MVTTRDSSTLSITTSDASSGRGGSVSLDTSHPYFLHPSDSLGMTLVTSIFDGRGYGGWRRYLLISL